MDFMRLLKSLEELLFEVASWLLFYPLTLWRSIRYPERMMRYADVELLDKDQEQYTDTLNPPTFLLISLLIAHGIELKLVRNTVLPLPSMLTDDSNLLIFRAVMFSIFPLLLALLYLRYRKLPLDRKTLKAPFYSQCYVAAPFALLMSLGGIVSRADGNHASSVGAVLAVAALAWYVAVQTRWFSASLGISALRAVFGVIGMVLAAAMVVILVSLAIALG
ncbi:permease [Rhizobiaceae bacterium n13]|uniref:Permease n=1 Tax=Ferirhizobium litorale TaxID=2927786 RepID=A0AAE3QBE4_9HYPH|nr:permease [Fererhizobium litorale]MDI7860612.1 permease [Fererhizobium litorale]MDI7920760.1 permease [Fererhizobium litorale]